MMIYVAFLLIFIGVTLALYQVYRVHYTLNFDDEAERSRPVNRAMHTLVDAAEHAAGDATSANFVREVERHFGAHVSPGLVMDAYHNGSLESLVRCRRHVEGDTELRIVHLPGWSTRPPARYPRGALLILLMTFSLLALFWGGMSVFTLAYPLPGDALAWANNLMVLTVLVYLSAALAWGTGKLDGYLHDIQQIGRLQARSGHAAG